MDIEYIGNFPCLYIQKGEKVFQMLNHLSEIQVVQRLADEALGMFESDLTEGYQVPNDTIRNLVYFHLIEMMGGKLRLTDMGNKFVSLSYQIKPFQSIKIQQYFHEYPRMSVLSRLAYRLEIEE